MTTKAEFNRTLRAIIDGAHDEERQTWTPPADRQPCKFSVTRWHNHECLCKSADEKGF